jgi:hypothetical protein
MDSRHYDHDGLYVGPEGDGTGDEAEAASPAMAFRCLVIGERAKQQRRWGTEHDARHSPAEWAAILAHEVGQFADAALNGGPFEQSEALVKIAAVCEAAATANKAMGGVVVDAYALSLGG